MRSLIAAVYYVLALFGCNGTGSTIVTHASINGVDTLYSKTRIQGDITRFECIRSASGRCHYTLFSRACASPSAAATGNTNKCAPDQPIEQFALAAGDRREVIGLSAFDQCVRNDAEPVTPDCKAHSQHNAAQ
jgi:hypothetical protein